MKLRIAILGVLVCALLSLVILYRPPASSLTRRTFRPAEIVRMPIPTDAHSPFQGDTSLGLDALRERVLAPYRLRPDARFLRAIGEVRHLSGAPDSAVTVEFAAGRWTVACGSQEVGSLSELPDFQEMLDLLTEWARTQAWARGWADAVGPRRLNLQFALDRLDAKAALREADRAWATGARDATLFRYLARAYTLWALETPESFGLSEDIAARAFAALAYARALGAQEPVREACLLADVLGYARDARERATALAPDDPVRMYVTWDDHALEASALAAPTLEAPLLQLIRAAQRADFETWSRLLPRFEKPNVPAEAVWATGLQIARFEAHLPIAEGLLRAVTDALGRPKSRVPPLAALLTSPTLAARIANFERIAGSRPERPGVLLDAELVLAQRRSLVYSALDRMGTHYMESLSSVEATRWFALGSARSRAAGPGGDFQRWYAHLASAMAGRPDPAALRSDIDSVAIGPAQALRTFEMLRTLIPRGDPTLRGAVHALVRRLDSRPEHRIALGNVAARDLAAPNLTEHYYLSAAGALGASNPFVLAWCARFRGDVDSLRVLLDTPNSNPWWRRTVLHVAAEAQELPDSTVQGWFEKEVRAQPAAWPVADEYADWLEKRNRYADARAVLQRWLSLERPDSGSAFESVFARTQVARLYHLEGRPADGLRVLGDLAMGEQFGAMQRTALIFQDLGRHDQALAVAWAAHRRYPHLLAGRVVLAEVLWRQGRHGQAAGMLRAEGRPISGHDWIETIAPRFVACFRGREREGIKAAEALLRAGFREQATIGTIPQKLSAERLDALAFEIQSRIRTSGIAQVEITTRAYGYLKRARGERAALDWLRRHLPGAMREPLCMFAHQERLPELLWTMAPKRLEGSQGDYYWLTRAAACMEAGPSHPRYAETRQYLATAQGTYYLEIARYLVGLRSQPQMLQLARSMKRRAEVYYFVGLKAQHEGRLREAADWFLMSVETGAINNAEPRWALYQLERWIGRHRSLGVIERSRPPV